MEKENQSNRADTPPLQAGPDTVFNRIGDEGVLIDMRTNRIYDLNSSGARFWELLCAGHDRATIRQLMLQEFDVAEAELDREIEDMLASLKREGLVIQHAELD